MKTKSVHSVHNSIILNLTISPCISLAIIGLNAINIVYSFKIHKSSLFHWLVQPTCLLEQNICIAQVHLQAIAHIEMHQTQALSHTYRDKDARMPWFGFIWINIHGQPNRHMFWIHLEYIYRTENISIPLYEFGALVALA